MYLLWDNILLQSTYDNKKNILFACPRERGNIFFWFIKELFPHFLQHIITIIQYYCVIHLHDHANFYDDNFGYWVECKKAKTLHIWLLPMTKSLQDANKVTIILFLTIIISIISSKVIELRYSDLTKTMSWKLKEIQTNLVILMLGLKNLICSIFRQ